jgi:ribosome maturation factor RimP
MNWQSAVDRTVATLGYELVDAERSAGGLLRVYIDKLPVETSGSTMPANPADAFITVDDCEKVTRQLQHVLEVEGCAYERLEVSSPGLDRPLKKVEHYRRFEGEQIELTLKMPFQGRKKYQGVLHAQGDTGWRVVFTDGKVEKALDFSLDEVRDARLVPVVDFKGRRFASRDDALQQAVPPIEASAGDKGDGDQIQ